MVNVQRLSQQILSNNSALRTRTWLVSNTFTHVCTSASYFDQEIETCSEVFPHITLTGSELGPQSSVLSMTGRSASKFGFTYMCFLRSQE